ncbi:MAG: lysylphosphatidylglycerol synthase transmembrane domain-containing protein [Porphyromonas sp.]|nr:lysylphosphatidylglycerol synthase transmembrane domain-containing protein [Porphyromonas sp.]
MTIRPSIKKSMKVLLPLFLGIFIFWLLYRDLEKQELLKTLKEGVHYHILALSLIFGLAANIFRGLRWNLLIQATNERPRAAHSILTTLGNYAVNMAFPRMGEVWRCGAMSQYSGIGFSKLFGTLLVDRVSDVAVVGLLVLLTLGYEFDFFAGFFASTPSGESAILSFLSSPWFYLAVLAFLAMLGVVYYFTKESGFVKKIRGSIQNVWKGILSIKGLERKWLFVLYTLLIWGGYFCFFYTTFYAFPFTRDLGVGIGLLTFTMSSIAVAAPVQAGIGAWHFMVIVTLTSFSVAEESAEQFALIVHTVQTLWITVCGLIAIFLLPLYSGKKVKEIKHQED